MTNAVIKFIIAATLTSATGWGAEYYVRDGGSCTSNCTSWTNASDQLSTALAYAGRGDTIWVADGNYSAITLNKGVSGSTPITIKKATRTDHGTASGWSDAYGDGQAVISDVTAITDYWVVDGQTRDENDWSNTAAYGFRITGSVSANTISFGAGSSNMTFRYVDIGGSTGNSYSSSIPNSGVYLGGFGSILRNWIISKSHIHNVKLPFQLAGASNITIEYSRLGPSWNKEAIRGQIHASNIIIRHNILKDACQGTPDDSTAGACTAQIAMWDGGSAGSFDGSKIYGNVFWVTTSVFHSDGCIMVGGDGGSTAAGVAANNVLVANNTFVGIKSGSCNIRFPGSHSGDIAQNNLWYGLASGVSSGCSANTCSTNATVTSDPFINSSGGNFRLRSATSGGTSLGSPYNVDLTGLTRGLDGLWDLGAYEYSSGPQSALPASPTGVVALVIRNY